MVYLFNSKGLRYASLGDAWFWAVGGFFYLVLVKLSGEVVSGKVGMGTLYGYWFLLLGIGTMLGSLCAAFLNRGRVEIGLTVIGGLGMPVVFMGLAFLDPLTNYFDFLCLCLGIFGALFFVPLNGYLQDKAEKNERACLGSIEFAYTVVWNSLGFNTRSPIQHIEVFCKRRTSNYFHSIFDHRHTYHEIPL